MNARDDDAEHVVLSKAEAEAFVGTLLDPPPPNDKLREAFEQHSATVRSEP